ncbi:MAG: hypothetical protein ACE5IK_14650 [Acidobacteriota bacterium]
MSPRPSTPGRAARAVGLATWILLAAAALGVAGQATAPAAPDPSIARYLGTWMHQETLHAQGSDQTALIEHYLLIRWHRGALEVKTVDYLPDRKVWGRRSNWKGKIRVDQWNVTTHTFTPRPDGIISVGFSGTNGVGGSTRAAWWAAGTLTWEKDGAGTFLHLVTTRGYAPSTKGNAWQPMDRRYRQISTQVDARIDRGELR